MSDHLAEKVAAIMQALQAPNVSTGPSKMACEITVCMPIYNGLRTFPTAINALEWGEQSVPMKLLLAENGSEDGGQLAVRDMARDSVTRRYWLRRGFVDLQVIEVPQNEEYPVAGRARAFYNIQVCLREMIEKVDTEFVLTVDHDVEAPRGCVRTMLEALKADDKIGIVGIKYDPVTAHVKHGLAMMRTEHARKAASGLEMRLPYRCPCAQFNEVMERWGLKCVELDPLSARHWRHES